MAKKLTDPRYAQAVEKFQSNPQQAMLEYKDNQDVQQFFKDFCGLLGEDLPFLKSNNNTYNKDLQCT